MKRACKIFKPGKVKIHASSPGGISSEHTLPLETNNFIV
jgi:hypothetical protein